MLVKLLVEGAGMTPNPVLSQKLGPLGIPMPQVIQKINEATKNFKGLKVPIELDIDAATKTFSVNVFSPPVSGLLKKELGIPKGSGEQAKYKVANASIEQLIAVADTKLPNMLCKDLKTAVKNVAGTCVSLGLLIENKPAKEVVKEIEKGVYDKEIKSILTTTSPEKLAKLSAYFEEVKVKQEKQMKQEQAAKAAADEAAAAAKVPAAGAAPVAGAAATTVVPAATAKAAAPAKVEAKKK
jgi:large subunit ribosomal protein L11